MIYAGDEIYDDDVTSGVFIEDELYCDYCDEEGHTFRSCPRRDDLDVEPDSESYNPTLDYAL